MFADTKNELNKIPQKSGKVSEAERNSENVSKLIEVFLYFSASLRFYLPPRTLFGVTRCRVVSISAADSGCLSCIDVLCFSSVRLISCTNMHIGPCVIKFNQIIYSFENAFNRRKFDFHVAFRASKRVISSNRSFLFFILFVLFSENSILNACRTGLEDVKTNKRKYIALARMLTYWEPMSLWPMLWLCVCVWEENFFFCLWNPHSVLASTPVWWASHTCNMLLLLFPKSSSHNPQTGRTIRSSFEHLDAFDLFFHFSIICWLQMVRWPF